jgi:hypothetical protein
MVRRAHSSCAPNTIHRLYASLALLLGKHITTINIIMYRIVKEFVLHNTLIIVQNNVSLCTGGK